MAKMTQEMATMFVTLMPRARSASTPSLASAFIITAVQLPASNGQSRTCVPEPVLLAAQKPSRAGAVGTAVPGCEVYSTSVI